MRTAFIAAIVALATPAVAAGTSPGTGASAAAAPGFSVETTEIGTLLDNPLTRTILMVHAPGLAGNTSFPTWRDLTLRDVQKLVGPTLTDQQMDAIQADFDKLSKH
jgi:para-nitrobenzyl esterase